MVGISQTISKFDVRGVVDISQRLNKFDVRSEADLSQTLNRYSIAVWFSDYFLTTSSNNLDET